MSSDHVLRFARSPAVVLFESDADNMWSSWVDYIIASRTKAGIFSVFARKWGDEYLDGRTKQKWFTIDEIRDIKTAPEFIKAVQRCGESLNVDIYWPEAIDALAALDQEFANEIESVVYE